MDGRVIKALYKDTQTEATPGRDGEGESGMRVRAAAAAAIRRCAGAKEQLCQGELPVCARGNSEGGHRRDRSWIPRGVSTALVLKVCISSPSMEEPCLTVPISPLSELNSHTCVYT